MSPSAPSPIQETASGYDVSVSVDIAHSYIFSQDVFAASNKDLAQCYKAYKRVLIVVDEKVVQQAATKITDYFAANNLASRVHPVRITEDGKSIETLLKICEFFATSNLVRREPVLVVGGGLVTDVVGFACSVYRRGTRYIRVPTSLIGLIDASVSNRVAVNWNGYKNRLGAYHEPTHTVIDSTFLRSLPQSEIRNGISEIIKISSCTDIVTFELVEQYGQDLMQTHFGLKNVENDELMKVGNRLIQRAIISVLEVEVPNSREGNLDRVMFFGHTWSPVLELAVEPPLLHGHAIAVDMAYSATLGLLLGHMSASTHSRFLSIFADLGLALDHPTFTVDLLKEATLSTIDTRDGQLRAPLPTSELGTYVILSQVKWETLEEAWHLHKSHVKAFPRNGLGLDMTIDVRTAE